MVGCHNSSEIKKIDLSQATPQSCLESFKPNLLKEALEKCNQIIQKFPKNPEPLNDRSLIYRLMGENILACKDALDAGNYINNSKKGTDPLIIHEISMRQESCKQDRNILVND